MRKKVNFYAVELFTSADDSKQGHRRIKELITKIIRDNAAKCDDFWVLALGKDNGLHYTADIYTYENEKLFMRMSSQKPSGGYLHRDYSTNVPKGILKGKSEDEQGIEVYTYVMLDYGTGILSIINEQSAPGIHTINLILKKYNDSYYLKFVPVPNPNGIKRIYEAKEPKISQIEIEVPIPGADALEQMFKWKVKDILEVQEGTLKATMRISGIGRQTITDGEEETKGVIDCIKERISDYNKAKVHAKAAGVKMQDYSFFDENFAYLVDIPTYTVISGQKRFYTANERVDICRDHLVMAYNENINLLKSITNR